MIKEFSINCNFKTTKAPVTFYVGDPSDDNHPIYFQSKWLSEKKGGSVPKEILDSFTELQKIAIKNHVSFQELCAFVIEEINSNQATINERKRINKNLTIIQNREIQKQNPSIARPPAPPAAAAESIKKENIKPPAAKIPAEPTKKINNSTQN